MTAIGQDGAAPHALPHVFAVPGGSVWIAPADSTILNDAAAVHGRGRSLCRGGIVKTVLQTNNIVDLSFGQALLSDAGIDSFVMDVHTSILEGSIGAIPRRLMVGDDEHGRAVSVLRGAGLLHD